MGVKDLDTLGVPLSVIELKAAESKKTRRYPLWWIIGLVVLLAVIAVTFVPGFLASIIDPNGEIHQPGMGDFFPESLIWESTIFQVNRLVLARFIAAFLVCAIVVTAAVRMHKVPSRGQAVIELLSEFVRKNIGIELLGNAKGRKYAVALATIFFGVLAMNLTGIIPGINIAASSVMSVPLVFAVFAYVTFVVAGIKARGGATFFKEQLFPPGIPWPVYFLITPIELFSTFIVRPATLAIRLLSNMIAGHMLLAITYFGTETLAAAVGVSKSLAVLTFAGSIVMTLFELFVAFLQAYVFTILTAVYIKMSVEAH